MISLLSSSSAVSTSRAGSRSSTTKVKKKKPSQALAAIALAMFLGLQSVVTDMFLPALPALLLDSGAPMPAVQMTLSAMILSFGLMQLVWGPLADRFGRRMVLLDCLCLMLAASVVAAVAPNIETLIAARAAQGAGLAGVVLSARALLRDLFDPVVGARIMAWGLSGLGLCAIVSPILGGVLAQSGWRHGLTAVAVAVGIVLLFTWRTWPETLRRSNAQAINLGTLGTTARMIWANPTFRAWALLVTFSQAGLFSLQSSSSFVYIVQIGLSPAAYGGALASGSLAYVVGTFVCRRWLASHGMAGAVRRGAAFSVAGGVGMAACALAGERAPLLGVLVSHWLYSFGHGIHLPCGQAGAVGPFPKSAGVAASWAGFIMAAMCFVSGWVLGASLQGQKLPIHTMGGSVAFWGLASAVVAWTLVQRHGEAARSR